MAIDVTGCDLRKLVSKAYELSNPQGLGFLNFKPGVLSDEEVDAILAAGNPGYPVSMDYVKGRAVKLSVRRDEAGRLTIHDRWFDHDDAQLNELCNALGVEREA